MENFTNSKNINYLIKKDTRAHGFALILLLMLMPLVLATISYLYITMTEVEVSGLLHQKCRQELLASQETSAQLLQKFMLINQKISQLKQKVITLEVLTHLLQDTSFPLSRDELRELLNASNSTSLTIDQIQKLFLLNYIKNKQTQIHQRNQALMEVFYESHRRVKKLLSISQIQVQSSYHSELPVEPHFNQSAFTLYKLKSNFQEIEKQSYRWSYQLRTANPLFTWAPWTQNFKGHCSATLQKETPWKPVLVADKFS